MKVIRYYLKDRRFQVLFFGLVNAVFYLIFALYRLPLEPILYASFLCLLILLPMMIFDFYHYNQQHRQRQLMKESIAVSDLHLLQAKTQLERDYLELLSCLRKEYKKTSDYYQNRDKDMLDYFTLWVHQMKLPISALKLLLETEEIPDKKLMKSELFKINQYVDMVLAYLRMDGVENDYVFAHVALDDLIRSAIRKFSTEFIRKKIKIDFQPTHQIVLTDEKWLTFVLEQLLSNALKYTHEGVIAIYAKDEKLIIEDTGIGIDASDLPRVFEKSYTGINGRIDQKASGLGLYLCKQILTQLACEIDITSKIHQGTKVILSLNHEQLKVE